MSGETIGILLLAFVTLDVVGVLVLVSTYRKREQRQARLSREVVRNVRPLSEASREHYERRPRDAECTLHDESPAAALEEAEQLFSDVLMERAFFAIDPEVAGRYAEARTKRNIARRTFYGKTEELEKTTLSYLATCEALISPETIAR